MQFDPHSPEHYRAVVDALKALGHTATVEHGFIGVEIDGEMWAFGTANETWDGNDDSGNVIATGTSIQETNASEVAQAISEAIQEHGDTNTPEFIAKVSDELKALGFESESGSTGGGFYNVFVDTTDNRKFCMGNMCDTAWGASYDQNDDFGDNLEDFTVPDLPNAKKVARLIGVELLAYEFQRLLRDDLSEREWEEMRERNREYQAEGNMLCCASQDVRDANMTMQQAFQNFGLKTSIDYETDSPEQLASVALWNEAWDRAKALYLTAERDPNREIAEAEAAKHPEASSAYQDGDTIHMQETIRNAQDAFWEVVAKAYPTAKSGDLSPGMSLTFDRAATDAVTEWIDNNVQTSN
jgi:hypothetical protein